MTVDIDAENILSDFATEEPLTPAVLREYIQRFPSLALELTDLFHSLTMADLEITMEPLPLETETKDEQLTKEVETVRTALSGDGLRDLARRLGLPRDFIVGFRDAKLRLGSVPANILLNLARAIDVRAQHFVVYLQLQRGAAGGVAFKADEKPQTPAVLEYEDFVESLRLNDDEAAALQRLAGSNGPR